MVIPTAVTRLIRNADPYSFFALFQMGFNFWDTVDDVAEQSGGEVVTSADDLRPAIQRMRKRYKRCFEKPPGKPGRRHRLDIELSPAARALHPEARILGRNGYVIPKETGK
jgi:hypothetical protein